MITTIGKIQRQIGARIRDLRLREGWTQPELARRAGVGLQTVVRAENSGNITIRRLLQVAAVLGVLDTFTHVLESSSLEGSLDDLKQPVRKRGRRRTS